MTISAKNIHLLVGSSELRLEIEETFLDSGFSIKPLNEAAMSDLSLANDSDIFIFDRRQMESLLKGPRQAVLRAGDLELHILDFEARCRGRRIRFTSSEFQLLRILCENSPNVISREKLVDSFSIMGMDLSVRTVDNHIFNIRKKLGVCDKLIQTIRGVGYKVLTN
jgi:DNA-binding response OmpR family regulator